METLGVLLGSSWGALGASWGGALGASWGALGRLLSGSWGVLGAPETFLGASLADLGASKATFPKKSH